MRDLYDPEREPAPRVRVPRLSVRCNACMGTNTVIPREALKELAFRPLEAEEPAEAEEAPAGPVRPEEWID